MQATSHAHQTLRFGAFDANLYTAELRKYGVRIHLEEQPFQILAVLLENPGELVTRDELRQKLWSAQTYVDFDRSLNKAVSKLRLALGDSAENPRFVETLHRRGYRFIAPVHVEEQALVVSPPIPLAVAPEHSDAEPESRDVKQKFRVLIWQAIAFAAIALLAAWVIPNFLHRDRALAASARPQVSPRRSIAVLGFKNLSGRPDQAWISTALADWLTTELSAGEQLRTVPAEAIARTRLELNLPDSDTLSPESLSHIAANLGTDLVVVGSYACLGKDAGGQVRLDLRLQNAHTAETVQAISETGTEAHLFDLVSQAGERLRNRLGIDAVTQQQAAEIAVALPKNHDAARLYSEGLAQLRLFNALQARDSFQKAIALEPEFALSHSALSTAWTTLGYDENARLEAKRAFELSSDLPRAERLLVEGRFYEASKSWDKAVQTYRALFAFFPDSLDYGLALSNAQVRGGKGKDALETVEALQKLPSPLGEDPRIDLAESRAAESIGDYKRDLASCMRAADKAGSMGASLLTAEAIANEAWALNNLGRPDEAVKAASAARPIFAAADDQRGVARAINYAGIALEYEGDSIGAKKMYEQALAIYRRIGNNLGVANELDDLGDVLLALGDLKGAKEKYEESLTTNQEIANPDGIALVKGALGPVLLALGDHQGAKSVSEESLQISRAIGDREKAAIALTGLASALRAEGDLEQARERENEAIVIFEEVGDRQSAARSQLNLADLSVDQGRPAEAVPIATRVAQEFEGENAIRDQSLANAVLARALLAEGKTSDAQAAIDRSLALGSKYHDRGVELLVAIAAASTRASLGSQMEKARAVERLQQTISESTRLGFLNYTFEGRLALGELEIASGNRAVATTQLKVLQKDAAERGWNRVANAAALLSKA